MMAKILLYASHFDIIKPWASVFVASCEIFSYSQDVRKMIPNAGHHFVNLFLAFQFKI